MRQRTEEHTLAWHFQTHIHSLTEIHSSIKKLKLIITLATFTHRHKNDGTSIHSKKHDHKFSQDKDICSLSQILHIYILSNPSHMQMNTNRNILIFITNKHFHTHEAHTHREVFAQMFTQTLVKGCCWTTKDAGVLGLWRRKIESGDRDEPWSLRAFV